MICNKWAASFQARDSHATAEHDHELFELAALSRCFHQIFAQMTSTAVLPAGEGEHCAKATRAEGLCHACHSTASVSIRLLAPLLLCANDMPYKQMLGVPVDRNC